MNNNVNTTEAVSLKSISPYLISRLEELEAVLAALDAAWECESLSKHQRRCIAAHTRRGLIDALADLDNLKEEAT